MLKSRPKTVIKFTACCLAAISVMLLLSLIESIPLYLTYRQKAGGPVTFSEGGYADLLTAYRSLLFVFVPALAVIIGGAACLILTNLKAGTDNANKQPDMLLEPTAKATSVSTNR